jgi:hypothetical protein
MCEKWPLGKCRFGADCKFAHGTQELRVDRGNQTVAPSQVQYPASSHPFTRVITADSSSHDSSTNKKRKYDLSIKNLRQSQQHPRDETKSSSSSHSTLPSMSITTTPANYTEVDEFFDWAVDTVDRESKRQEHDDTDSDSDSNNDDNKRPKTTIDWRLLNNEEIFDSFKQLYEMFKQRQKKKIASNNQNRK